MGEFLFFVFFFFTFCKIHNFYVLLHPMTDVLDESGPITYSRGVESLLEVPISTSGSTCTCYRVERDGKVVFKKQLKQELRGTSFYHDLFRKEYEVGASVDCPYVVRYLDFVDDEVGCFVLTEFVNGDTLEERLALDPQYFRNEANLRKFLRQLLLGLEYLHAHQVVHLDLKPSNIMLTKVNNDVKILDVGYCYADSHQSLLGFNAQFAAPEQLDGSGDVDARSDIYAVGKLIKYIDGSLQHVDTEKVTTPPPILRGGRGVAQISERCCRDNKSDRYQSAAEVLRVLDAPSHKRLKWLIACLLLVVGIVGVCLSPAYRHLHRWAFGYDFRYCGVCYRVLSEEQKTCEAVDYHENSNKLRNNTDVTIESIVRNGDERYTVVSIGDSAFVNKHMLRSLSIPSTVRHIGSSAFRNCVNITALSIPDNVEEIEPNAFCQLKSLASVRYPSSARVVPYFCFHQSALREIDLPEGVTVINQDAFVDCDSLRHVNLPSTLVEIGRGVFFECDNLEQITIPASVKSIGEYCFMCCPHLKRVYNLSPVPQRVVELFDENTDIQVFVPDEALELYRSTTYWKDLNTLPISDYKM